MHGLVGKVMVNSYAPLKEKYDELEKKFKEKEMELNELKSRKTLTDDKLPAFLFTDTATNDELYEYLKENPQYSKFIYNEYTGNQNFIKKLCNPDSSLYLEKVADNLKELYEYQETIKEYEKTKEDIAYNKDEIEKLKMEIQEQLDKYDEIEKRLNDITKQEEIVNKQKGNIRSDQGLEKIKSTLDSVLKLTESILAKYKERFKENPTEVNTLGIKISKENITSIELLNRVANETVAYIQDNDFLSPDNLDETRKKLLEQINEEKQSAKNEMDSLMEYNPKRVLLKLIQNVDQVSRKIDNATDDGADGRYLNKFTVGFIDGTQNESLDYLNRIVDQIENKGRRDENEKNKNGIFHKNKN